MAANEPFWSMGELKVITDSGEQPTADGDWSFGELIDYFEYVAAGPGAGAIMNQIQGSNLGADLYNGTLL